MTQTIKYLRTSASSLFTDLVSSLVFLELKQESHFTFKDADLDTLGLEYGFKTHQFKTHFLLNEVSNRLQVYTSLLQVLAPLREARFVRIPSLNIEFINGVLYINKEHVLNGIHTLLDHIREYVHNKLDNTLKHLVPCHPCLEMLRAYQK
jgi:hypothetical protein